MIVSERRNINMLWNQVYKDCAPCLNYFGVSGPGWCYVIRQLMFRNTSDLKSQAIFGKSVVSYNLSGCIYLTAKTLRLLPRFMASQTI